MLLKNTITLILSHISNENNSMQSTKISYSNKNNSEFIKELKANVADYFEKNKISKYGNTSLFLKTIFMFILYFGPYALMMAGIIESWLGVFFCWVLIGFGKAGVGMGIMHDANHRTYSKNARLNKLMSKTMFLVGGFPANWQRQHNTMHHGFTNIDGRDEDINPSTSIVRLSPHKPLKKVHRYQYLYAWFLYGLMTILWITTKDFSQLSRYKKQGLSLSNGKSYTYLYVSMISAKVLYYIFFLVLPLIVLPFAWYWILLFFFTMHFTTGLILGLVFQSAHVTPTSEYPLPNDQGTIENSFAIHQLLNTANFAPKNKVLSWLIGGLNHQVEHHLFPGVCHVHYNAISKMVKEMTNKYKLPYHEYSSFYVAVIEHTRMLKQLGRA